MNHAQLFCDLAYAALRREEEELANLAGLASPRRRPISVCVLGETTLHYLIAKEALRHSDAPLITTEYRFGREYVDLCFVRELDGSAAVTSFELKIISKDDDPAWQKKVRDDIVKHLDTAKDIGGAERYNCLLVITERDLPKEALRAAIEGCASGLLSDPVFFIADSIQLNQVITTNANAHRWRYLSVIVFTGTFIVP